jgi:PEP-CTERM motif
VSTKNPSSALSAALAPIAVAVATIVSPGIARADAIAQSYLYLKNITIAPAGGISNVSGTDSGDVSASLNGAAPTTDNANPALFTGFNLNVSQGAGPYAPGVALTGSPTTTVVGSSAIINNGSPFLGNAEASTDDTVSLLPGGVGTSFSNTGLQATYNFAVSAGTKLTFSFDADAFLRAFLDPAGVIGSSAQASYSWSITVDGPNGYLFSWSPDGIVNTITGGTENLDAFDMTDTKSALPAFPETTTGLKSGSFSATTNDLAAGNYQVNIRHASFADAQLLVPEPSALALAGVALLGAGIAGRRGRSKAK